MAISITTLELALLLSSTVHNLDLSSLGVIRTVGVRAYWDVGLKDEAKEVQWGTLYIGVPRNITLHLHSVSNVQVTLSLKTWNWTLINCDDKVVSGSNDSVRSMNFAWSYSGQVLHPNDIYR